MSSTCPEISIFSTSIFLKITMSTQLLFGLISMIGVFFTIRKILSSIQMDLVFKEYLCLCYFVQLFQSCALFLLQSILLTIHLSNPPCLSTISSTLCYGLRFGATAANFALPFLNFSLAIFRLFNFLYTKRKMSDKKFRFVLGVLMIIISLELWWKYGQDPWPTGDVSYCLGNPKTFAEKTTIESMVTTVFEVITILIGLVVMRLYQTQKRKTRSYNISVNLTRRQLVQTMHLFLPYSIFHSFCFLIFNFVAIYYRPLLTNLAEPYFSAASGFFFIPMYFTAIAPWILYGILRKTEQKRQNSTQNLISLERQANSVYFNALKDQWKW